MFMTANAANKPTTEASEGSKGQESDHIKIPQLPSAPQLEAWENSVRSAVSSASRTPEESFQWIIEVEDDAATFEMFAICSKKFSTLDAKLSAALTLTCKGKLCRKRTLRTNQEAKAKRLIRGRQLLDRL